MTPEYTEAKKEYDKINSKINKLKKELAIADTRIKESRRNFTTECACGYHTQLKNIELLMEDSGSYDNYGEMYYAQYKYLWVCPKCSELLVAPVIDGLTYNSSTYKELFKTTYDYHKNRPTKTVEVILAPHIKKVKDRETEWWIQHRIKEAQETLLRNGFKISKKDL